jgi:hypothetical protein
MQQISESRAPSAEAAKSPSLDDVQRIDRQSLAPGGAVAGRAGGGEWRWRAADEVEGPGEERGGEGSVKVLTRLKDPIQTQTVLMDKKGLAPSCRIMQSHRKFQAL